MRTVTTNVYLFTELSEEAQQKVIKKYYDINVSHDWWLDTYKDAEIIGLKLQYFGLDRNKHATGSFITNAKDCADLVIHNHGDTCETYSLAVGYLAGYDNITNEEEDNETFDELNEEFLKNLLSAYADILQRECEYLQTDEAIKESIIANEYEFTENGKRF